MVPHRLLKLALALSAASKAFGGPLPKQGDLEDHRGDQAYEPRNANFETGNLEGWQVVQGDAFGNRSVTDSTSYWGGPFHQDQKYFIWGITQAGESAVGELKSSSFRASSVLSFLVGGGYDPDNLYVGLVRDRDNQLLLKQTGTNDEALIRITWDTSKWAGQMVHIVVHDSSTSESWGHINFDDLRVGRRALGNGDGLTFQVIGQANQPPFRNSRACSLYAADPLRPQYHYTPYQGWINDPAGLSQWRGRHHLFSQFHPDSPMWGPMYWSHVVSTDAVHWRELPVALSPAKTSIPGDESGRFTGSAMVHGGELHLVFTDYVDTRAHPGAVQESVAVASSKSGDKFKLSPSNPAIPGPPAGAPVFFRDPKVFHDPTDNSWKMVLGATNGASGQVQLYRGSDPFSWSHIGVMYTGDGSTGAVWECPNFFPVGDKWVLFYGGNGLGLYETGTYNGSVFTSEKRGLVNAGPASYAMQWYKDESGRNLAIDWMGNWPTSKWPTRANGWAGQHSVTRELFLREDGGLGSRPIAELDSLASGPTTKLGPLQVGEQARSIASTNTARVKLSVDLGATSASSFTLALFQSKAESTLLTYEIESRKLTLDTSNAGYGQAGQWDAVLAEPKDNKLTLDIFLDRGILEVFVGDGTVMSATVWPRYRESTGISVIGNKGTLAFGAISVTPLSSSWC
ncbi:glycoside hydrolase family 32 protein [Parathielavia appendiculata]|uniref:beta-fructofuranosidase n=1 Tax=Parathielavia appendiculata TaxID=2587402 RepID=A0AAN6TPL1_9PEZI|nr:glycoside hydrolase family 32 protein [Parathielavia appendiculata]